MATIVTNEKENFYRQPLEKLFGKDTFELELEDYEESKFLVISTMDGEKIVNPCLFISINKKTGIAKGFSSNPRYQQLAKEIKKEVEMAYRREKYSVSQF